jgi:hypothetical protein
MKSSRPKRKSKAHHRTRREFLVAGGAVVTTLSLPEARPKVSRSELSSSQARIQEIMERYGSELGDARFVS